MDSKNLRKCNTASSKLLSRLVFLKDIFDAISPATLYVHMSIHRVFKAILSRFLREKTSSGRRKAPVQVSFTVRQTDRVMMAVAIKLLLTKIS